MASMSDPSDDPPPAPDRPVIKRRWAIVRRASGGAALLAITGAMAIAEPDDQTDPGQSGADAGAQISAES